MLCCAMSMSKWSETRNRCSVELINRELMVTQNFEERCDEFFTNIRHDKNILAAARSNKKYSWKMNE